MLQNIEAVIFDLDGTLIDSMWVWETIDQRYIEAYHIVKPEDFHTAVEGMSYTETAIYFRDEFKLPMTVEEIKQDWLDQTTEMYRNQVPLKQGVLTFLQYLQGKGIKIGIATSSPRELVEIVLEAREIRDYFQVISTSCEVNAGKPEPDVYLKAADVLGVMPEHCLAFEDVEKGIMAGKNAGMKVSAVEDKSNETQREQLRKIADYYIRTFDDVLKNTYEVL